VYRHVEAGFQHKRNSSKTDKPKRSFNSKTGRLEQVMIGIGGMTARLEGIAMNPATAGFCDGSNHYHLSWTGEASDMKSLNQWQHLREISA
jgi:hypothetical protein